MTVIDARQNEFIDNLAALDNWADRFNYIIDLGKELPVMPDHLRTVDNLITPCNSRTYFSLQDISGVLDVYGWSNALIPQGLCAICRSIFNGLSRSDVENAEIYFHAESGLLQQLTYLRQQSLQKMINICVG